MLCGMPVGRPLQAQPKLQTPLPAGRHEPSGHMQGPGFPSEGPPSSAAALTCLQLGGMLRVQLHAMAGAIAAGRPYRIPPNCCI